MCWVHLRIWDGNAINIKKLGMHRYHEVRLFFSKSAFLRNCNSSVILLYFEAVRFWTHFSCKRNDCFSNLYVRLLSKYIKKHLRPCPGNQLFYEHSWCVTTNIAEEWAEWKGQENLTGISSQLCLQVIGKII